MAYNYKIRKCGVVGCYTCPFVNECNFFNSNSTGLRYFPRTAGQEYLNCKSENVIYLIFCEICNFQYVGETKNRLQTRFSNHRSMIRSGKSCQLVHKHFQEDCHGLRNCGIIPIEKIDIRTFDNSNLNSAQLDREVSKLRFEREKFWITKLQTAYPFGLNSRVKGIGDFNPSQGIFQHFGGRRRRKRHSKRKPKRLRARNDFSLDFILRKHRELSGGENYIHFFKMFLYGIPRVDLQQLLQNMEGSVLNIDIRLKDLVSMISTMRLFRPVEIQRNSRRDFYHLNFRDKGLDHINIGSILRNQNVMNKIPIYFVNKEPPIIGYRFNKCISGSILNYKETLQGDLISRLNNNTLPCNCQTSRFKDNQIGHIITGDLDIIENVSLRNIFKKGPKYRLPQKINWDKDRDVILSFLNTYITKWLEKEKKLAGNVNIDRRCLNVWKECVLDFVDKKISNGKRKFRKSWSLKIEGSLERELNRLKENYVITVADKAQNNLLFTCKAFYVSKIKEELMRPGQLTYQLEARGAMSINSDIINFSKSKKVKVPDNMTDIPIIYWIPKMHKNPIGSRFIAGSKYCSIKSLSKNFSKAMKLILNHMRLYSNTVYERTNLKYYWIIDNSLDFMDSIRDKNVNHMETYDFSTLYTALPHQEILRNFSKIFQKVFQREGKQFINVSFQGTYFSSSELSGGCSFRIGDMMEILEFILDNIFVKFGDQVFKQVIGIPIGLDSGQDIANLLLFSYESNYVERISKTNMILARKFSLCSRYIDDLFVGNFPSFKDHIYEIYPRALEIKPEFTNPREVAYLDLKIKVENDNLMFSIYDKRDDFNFEIVNFPFMDSCIPKKSALGVYYSQLIRYARINSKFIDFKFKSKNLCVRLRTQGYLDKDLRTLTLRFFNDRQILVSKYNINNANDFLREVL